MSVRRGIPRLLAALLLYLATVRPWIRNWGASTQESCAALPGDDLVAARWHTTRGIAIATEPADVWPWLVQIGYGRGGWYSYDWLERLVRAGDFVQGGSAKSLIPELQTLTAGSTVLLSATGGPTAAIVDPPRTLVLHYKMNLMTAGPASDLDNAVLDWTLAFALVPMSDVSCRLLARVRADYRPRSLALLIPSLL